MVVTGLFLGGVYKCLLIPDRTKITDQSDGSVQVQLGEAGDLLGEGFLTGAWALKWFCVHLWQVHT